MTLKRALTLALALLALGLYFSLDKPNITPRQALSKQVLDREGRLLRAYTAEDKRWRLGVKPDAVDNIYLKMLVTYEDKRFYLHFGVDNLALIRASFSYLTGKKTSGASTLTMQVSRLLTGENTKTIYGKLRQIHFALRLEKYHTKQEILEIYLTLAPFGSNLEGVRAASIAYFNKEPRRLSPAESALLVALPQAPESRRPDKASASLESARRRVLIKARDEGIISNADFELALLENLPHAKQSFPAFAPQLSDVLIKSNETIIKTTLDLPLQSRLESLVKEAASPLDAKLSFAVLVIENATGEVKASVGGVDYYNKDKAGYIDLTRAVRSPGSALKPFIYGLAFDYGLAHPETLLDDRPTRYGFWSPENFEQGFSGQATARVALQQSLNLPAVELLNLLGAQRFLTKIKGSGLMPYLPKNADTGLAVGLGGVGVTLHDLTQSFTAFPRGGAPVQLTYKKSMPMPKPNLLSPVASFYVSDILKGAPPPFNAPANLIAYKTGTSYGYRDAWAVGFDSKHTLGVWAGRADNASVSGLIGRGIAAPVLFDAFAILGVDKTPFKRPDGVITARNSDLPPPLKRRTSDDNYEEAALKITFPSDGVMLERSEGALTLKIQGGKPPYIFMLNEQVLEQTARKQLEIEHPSRGFHRLTVIDSAGVTSQINVRIE